MSDPLDLAIPGFRLLSVLGRGGCGTVYRARQEALDRVVALKVLHADLTARPAEKRRFRQEAKLMASLVHPHVMRVLGSGEAAAGPYIALELIEGGTLRQRIDAARDRGGPALGGEEAMRLARDLLDALVTLHEAGIVHRDVKPGNVMFRASGDAVLSDFGMAKVEGREVTAMTATGQLVGTLAYLPPEVFEGKAPGPKGDLFALGVLLFEALTGQHPTDFKPFQVVRKIPEPGVLAPEAPRPLCTLIKRLLELDPDGRPGSAREALEALSFVPTAPTKVLVRADANDPGRPSIRHRGRLARAALLLACALGTVLLVVGLAAALRPRAEAARPHVTVIGLEGAGDTLSLWLTARPPLELVDASGARQVVGAQPARYRLDARVAAPAVTLRDQAGSEVKLTVALDTARRQREGPRLPELGLAVPMHQTRMGLDPQAPRVTDWLITNGLGWFASTPDEQGRTRLDPALYRDLAKRGGVRSLAVVRPTAAPGGGALERELAALAAEPARPWITFQDGPFDAADGDAEWEPVPGLVALWRARLAQALPGMQQLAPPVWALNGVRAPDPRSNPEKRVEVLIMSVVTDDPSHFQSSLRQLRATFGDRFAASGVRLVLACAYMTDVERAAVAYSEARPAEATPLGVPRVYVMARRYFPGAPVITDLAAIANRVTRGPGRAWGALNETATRLAGLTYQGTTPIPGALQAFTFGAGDRVVHAIVPGRGGAAQGPPYRPYRAGVTVKLTLEGETVIRPQADAAPVPIPTDGTMLMYEELARPRLTVEPPDAFEIENH